MLFKKKKINKEELKLQEKLHLEEKHAYEQKMKRQYKKMFEMLTSLDENDIEPKQTVKKSNNKKTKGGN